MNRVARVFAFALLLISGSLSAVIVGDSTPRRISAMHSYPQFGGGDVIAYLDAPISSNCFGIWLPPIDPGFKQTFGVMTAARVTNSPLLIWVLDDQKWNGSATPFCKVYAVSL